MRLVVMFDLPVKKRVDRRAYAQFRRFLLKDGYDMLQFSNYSRICNGLDTVDKHVLRLRRNAPGRGCVRWMVVTEKQFVGIEVLVGEKKRIEKAESSAQLSLF